MNTIIVPTDFSSTAGAALRYGLYLARELGYELEVLHVHDGYGHSQDDRVRKNSMEAHLNAQRGIDDFVRFNTPPVTAGEAAVDVLDVPVRSREVVGSPAPAILEASAADNARLIVMGGVGTGKVSPVSPAFGSVARSVVEGANCPVLLIPRDYGEPEVKTIAIAYDEGQGLQETSKAFDFIREAIQPAVHFVHVRDYSDKVESRKEASVMDAIFENGFPGYAAELDLLPPGPVHERLVEYAVERKVDLLVLGHRKRGFWKRVLFGSNTAPVITGGDTPMMVVPIGDY